MTGVNDSACVYCLELPTILLEMVWTRRSRLSRIKRIGVEHSPKEQCSELCINRREVGAVIEVIASPFHPQIHTSASQGKFGAMANDRGQGAHHAQLTVLPKIGIKVSQIPE